MAYNPNNPRSGTGPAGPINIFGQQRNPNQQPRRGGMPSGFTAPPSGSAVTLALEPYYNPSTGEIWTASSGGFTPGPGWVRGRPPAGTESRYTSWVAPEQEVSSGDGTTLPGSAQAVPPTSAPSMAGEDQLDSGATQNLRAQGITSLNAYRDVNGGLYYATIPRIRAEGAEGTGGGRRARVAIDSAGRIGSYPQPEAPTYQDAQPTTPTTPTPESQIIDRSDYRHPDHEAWSQEYELEQAEDDRVAEEIYEKSMNDPNHEDYDKNQRRVMVWGWKDGVKTRIPAPEFGRVRSSYTSFENFFNDMLAGGTKIAGNIVNAITEVTQGLPKAALAALKAVGTNVAYFAALAAGKNDKAAQILKDAQAGIASPGVAEVPAPAGPAPAVAPAGPAPAGPAPAVAGPQAVAGEQDIVNILMGMPKDNSLQAEDNLEEGRDIEAYPITSQDIAVEEARLDAIDADKREEDIKNTNYTIFQDVARNLLGQKSDGGERAEILTSLNNIRREKEQLQEEDYGYDEPSPPPQPQPLVPKQPIAAPAPVVEPEPFELEDDIAEQLRLDEDAAESRRQARAEARAAAEEERLEAIQRDADAEQFDDPEPEPEPEPVDDPEPWKDPYDFYDDMAGGGLVKRNPYGYANGGLVDELPTDIETLAPTPLVSNPNLTPESEGPLPNYNLEEEKKDFYAKQKERQDLVRVHENYAKGGLVNRRLREGKSPPNAGVADDLPRNLSEGEYVIPKRIVDHFGEKFFEDLLETIPPPSKTLVQLRI